MACSNALWTSCSPGALRCSTFRRQPKPKPAVTGAGLSGLDPTKPTDVKERFRAPYDSNLSPGYSPERPPGFREAISVFHEAGLVVLRELMHGVALSLGLPEEYFDAAHEQHTGAVMLLHYPPITEPFCRDSFVLEPIPTSER